MALFAIAIVGCTPAESPVGVAEVDAGSAQPAVEAGASDVVVLVIPDASPTRMTQPVDAGAHCAATYAEAALAPCFYGNPPCTYPEGRCSCDVPPQCGGAIRPPPPEGKRFPTACTPNVPPPFRADGCPWSAPANGSKCAVTGKACSYGECSWSAAHATCVAGAWKITQYSGPPPP